MFQSSNTQHSDSKVRIQTISHPVKKICTRIKETQTYCQTINAQTRFQPLELLNNIILRALNLFRFRCKYPVAQGF